jgi:hypothetical protein
MRTPENALTKLTKPLCGENPHRFPYNEAMTTITFDTQ